MFTHFSNRGDYSQLNRDAPPSQGRDSVLGSLQLPIIEMDEIEDGGIYPEPRCPRLPHAGGLLSPLHSRYTRLASSSPARKINE